jgi:hypothetical protein
LSPCPFHPLVRRVVAMLRLCASVPSRMGGLCPLICVERGLCGIVVVYPVAVEVWTSWWGNDRGHVGSEVHTFLSTVQDRVRPISGNGCCSGGARSSWSCQGRHASLRRGGSVPRGSGAPVPMLEGSGEAENAPDGLQGLGALMMSWGLGRGKRSP